MAAFAVLAWLPAGPASAADDFLVASDPEPHEELDSAPGWVTLVFQRDSDAELAKIVVQNSAGQDVTTGPPIVEGTNVTTQLLAPLPKDTFTVTYRTSDDEHGRRGGAYQFSFGPGTWTEVDDTWVGEDEEPSVIATPPPPAPEPTETAESVPPTSAPESPTTKPSSPVTTPEPSQEPSPAPGSNLTVWLVGLGVALLVVAGVVALVNARRSRPAHSEGTPPTKPKAS